LHADALRLKQYRYFDVIKAADSARCCFGVAEFPSIQIEAQIWLKPCWSIIESSRTVRTAECLGTNDPETEGKCDCLRPYLVMAVSSNGILNWQAIITSTWRLARFKV
jgi:hypothetical protein